MKDHLTIFIHHMQDMLQEMHPSAMNDDMRTDICISIWKKFADLNNIKFGYINFIVKPEHDNQLIIHCDVMNDKKDSYQYSPVYWYLHTHEGIRYRVTIVLTFRSVCGDTMDEIRSKV